MLYVLLDVVRGMVSQPTSRQVILFVLLPSGRMNLRTDCLLADPCDKSSLTASKEGRRHVLRWKEVATCKVLSSPHLLR